MEAHKAVQKNVDLKFEFELFRVKRIFIFSAANERRALVEAQAVQKVMI